MWSERHRRTREKMPAHDFEAKEALEEGVKLKWLSTITEAGEGSITIEKMALDEKGFPQPTGEFEELPADSVVLALGQNVEQSLLERIPNLETKWDSVQTDAVMMTSHDSVFAGGDMVAGNDRTVTMAVGHGKRAARAIDAWLCSERYQPAARHELATFERLNTWYYANAEKTVRPTLDIIRRQSTFDEVVGGAG
ncbi:FAD-dependent oxidoreductase [Thiothrix nivea]|uniref:FAD-dependent oxidoreductase n=1 Tax=Thiothrix nivea TaxID=1031 RepID=UPI00030F6FBA|nr:FAD-dependent oxidoreductase [Thiothrix nivea]